jgi:hypothetical protein
MARSGRLLPSRQSSAPLADGPAGTIALGIADDEGVLPVYQLR